MSIVGYRHTVDAAEIVATQDDGYAMGVRVHTVPDKFHDCAHWVPLMRKQLNVIVGRLQVNTFHYGSMTVGSDEWAQDPG